MTLFQAIALGIVQGLTEFLPISSSAHLALAKWLMGISPGEHLLYFDLICHSGTLIALIFYLRYEIFSVLSSIHTMALFILALIPLAPAYFFLKPLIRAASNPSYLGYFLLLTAFLLFIAVRKKEVIPQNRIKKRDVLCIGCMQTLALLPGISRSGSTIAAARLLGWEWKKAARFSFLLAVPAILGGQILETAKWMGSHPEKTLSMNCYFAGFFTSLVVGLLSVRAIFWIYEKGNVRPFAWYCLAAGLLAIWMLHG